MTIIYRIFFCLVSPTQHNFQSTPRICVDSDTASQYQMTLLMESNLSYCLVCIPDTIINPLLNLCIASHFLYNILAENFTFSSTYDFCFEKQDFALHAIIHYQHTQLFFAKKTEALILESHSVFSDFIYGTLTVNKVSCYNL